MIALHPATLHLIGVVVTLTCAAISLLTWYHHRSGLGLRGWAAALLLGTLGTFLYGLREPDSPFRAIMAADALFVAAFAATWISMRRVDGRGPAIGRMIAIIGAVTAIFVALSALARQFGNALHASSIVFSLTVAALALAAARATWMGRRLDGLRSRSIAALPLLGIGLARLLRAATVIAVDMGLVSIETNAIAQGYTLYFTTVCILVVTFGLVLMANERFERRVAQLADGPPAAD